MLGKFKEKLKGKKAEGEYLSFAFIVTIICGIVVVIISFAQLSSNLNKLNNTLSVVARTAAVSSSLDAARENASLAASSAIPESNFISNVTASVEYLDTAAQVGEWDAGTQLLVTVSADIKTFSPFISGTQTRSSIVSVETIMSGILSGMLRYSVTNSYPLPSNPTSLGGTYSLSSGYGSRTQPTAGASTNHKGLDFGMAIGTSLYAPTNCKVVHTSYHASRGNWVVLYVGNGYYVEYEHCSAIYVTTGQYLSKGDLVAASGNTGASTGPHLHLGILYAFSGKDTITNFNDDSYRINPYSFVFG